MGEQWGQKYCISSKGMLYFFNAIGIFSNHEVGELGIVAIPMTSASRFRTGRYVQTWIDHHDVLLIQWDLENLMYVAECRYERTAIDKAELVDCRFMLTSSLFPSYVFIHIILDSELNIQMDIAHQYIIFYCISTIQSMVNLNVGYGSVILATIQCY